MEVRTGDTAAKERSAPGPQQAAPVAHYAGEPQYCVVAIGLARGGFQPRTVIVDEIHALAESKRGSLLALALERLESRASGPLQRIGLSATAWPVEAVTSLLCGDRPCEVAAVDLRKAHRLDIAVPGPDRTLPPAGHSPYRIAAVVADHVERAACSLAFTTTRSAAERLALALKILLPEHEDRIEVHHGSVDQEARLRIEDGLSQGVFKAVVCSSSLELGVDFSAVDQVLLIGAPRGVSRAMQRLGRSGHRVGGVARGSLVALSLPDLLECAALREAASNGKLDALRIPQAALDVLAQALLAMSIERPWHVDEAFDRVRRAGPYRKLAREDFDAILEYLAGRGRVLGSYETYGKIVFDDDGVSASRRRRWLERTISTPA
jgi:ATP-dependent helicase Lhr and Lhr-like helicase